MQILKVILLLGLSLKGVFLEDKVSGESHAMDYHDPAEIVKTEDYKSRKEGGLKSRTDLALFIEGLMYGIIHDQYHDLDMCMGDV